MNYFCHFKLFVSSQSLLPVCCLLMNCGFDLLLGTHAVGEEGFTYWAYLTRVWITEQLLQPPYNQRYMEPTVFPSWALHATNSAMVGFVPVCYCMDLKQALYGSCTSRQGLLVDWSLTSHSAIFQQYSDGTVVQFPNLDLLPGTQCPGQLESTLIRDVQRRL